MAPLGWRRRAACGRCCPSRATRPLRKSSRPGRCRCWCSAWTSTVTPTCRYFVLHHVMAHPSTTLLCIVYVTMHGMHAEVCRCSLPAVHRIDSTSFPGRDPEHPSVRLSFLSPNQAAQRVVTWCSDRGLIHPSSFDQILRIRLVSTQWTSPRVASAVKCRHSRVQPSSISHQAPIPTLEALVYRLLRYSFSSLVFDCVCAAMR